MEDIFDFNKKQKIEEPKVRNLNDAINKIVSLQVKDMIIHFYEIVSADFLLALFHQLQPISNRIPDRINEYNPEHFPKITQGFKKTDFIRLVIIKPFFVMFKLLLSDSYSGSNIDWKFVFNTVIVELVENVRGEDRDYERKQRKICLFGIHEDYLPFNLISLMTISEISRLFKPEDSAAILDTLLTYLWEYKLYKLNTKAEELFGMRTILFPDEKKVIEKGNIQQAVDILPPDKQMISGHICSLEDETTLHIFSFFTPENASVMASVNKKYAEFSYSTDVLKQYGVKNFNYIRYQKLLKKNEIQYSVFARINKLINELSEVIELFYENITSPYFVALFAGLPGIFGNNEYDKIDFIVQNFENPFSILFELLMDKSFADFEIEWVTVFDLAIKKIIYGDEKNKKTTDESEKRYNCLIKGSAEQVPLTLLHLFLLLNLPKIFENDKDQDLKNIIELLVEEYKSPILMKNLDIKCHCYNYNSIEDINKNPDKPYEADKQGFVENAFPITSEYINHQKMLASVCTFVDVQI